MKHPRRHFSWIAVGMFGLLLAGYLLLGAVVWFSEEINHFLRATEAATPAETSAVTTPVLSPAESAQTILNNPENFRNVTIETSPALRRASGEQMFLMEF